MPVQLGSKLPPEQEARIEIIPLIDIMFFLLAAFMLVSLSMVKLKSVKVDLPTATAATADTKKNILSISVDKAGTIYLEKTPMGGNELATRLAQAKAGDDQLSVFISGDKDARHGAIIRALDIARSVGFQRIGMEIQPVEEAASIR
jgi:biopolymer transport protein ExbD